MSGNSRFVGSTGRIDWLDPDRQPAPQVGTAVEVPGYEEAGGWPAVVITQDDFAAMLGVADEAGFDLAGASGQGIEADAEAEEAAAVLAGRRSPNDPEVLFPRPGRISREEWEARPRKDAGSRAQELQPAVGVSFLLGGDVDEDLGTTEPADYSALDQNAHGSPVRWQPCSECGRSVPVVADRDPAKPVWCPECCDLLREEPLADAEEVPPAEPQDWMTAEELEAYDRRMVGPAGETCPGGMVAPDWDTRHLEGGPRPPGAGPQWWATVSDPLQRMDLAVQDLYMAFAPGRPSDQEVAVVLATWPVHLQRVKLLEAAILKAHAALAYGRTAGRPAPDLLVIEEWLRRALAGESSIGRDDDD